MSGFPCARVSNGQPHTCDRPALRDSSWRVVGGAGGRGKKRSIRRAKLGVPTDPVIGAVGRRDVAAGFVAPAGAHAQGQYRSSDQFSGTIVGRTVQVLAVFGNVRASGCGVCLAQHRTQSKAVPYPRSPCAQKRLLFEMRVVVVGLLVRRLVR